MSNADRASETSASEMHDNDQQPPLTPMDITPMGDEENEDDTVLAEFPIFLSNKLAKHLYLFQYPLRNRPFTRKSGPVAARMKPTAKLVELDLPLDTRSPLYNTERGEDFAQGTNDKPIKTAYDRHIEEHEEDMRGKSKQPKQDELLSKMTLTSISVPAQTKYLVGILHEGELHVTPINTMVQLRPGLTYIDKIDEKYKAANKRINDAERQEERKRAQDQAEAQAVQVSMKNTDHGGTSRQNLYSMAVRNADEEAWQPVAYYDQTTQQAERVYESLYCSSRTELKSAMSHGEYLNHLCGTKKQLHTI